LIAVRTTNGRNDHIKIIGSEKQNQQQKLHDQSEYEKIIGFLTKEKYIIYILEGSKITNINELFQEFAATFPQQNRVAKSGNWSAIADNLWGFLPDGKVCIIWKDVSFLMNADFDLFLFTFEIFADVATQVANRGSSTVDLQFFYLDFGLHFPSWNKLQ
jgi:hypothetical protein